MTAPTPNPVADLLAALAEPPALPNREWFTVRDLSILTGRAMDTLREWRARGLPWQLHGKRPRRQLYVSRSDLAAWLAAHPEALPAREQRLRKLAAACAPAPWPTTRRREVALLRRRLREHRRLAELCERALRAHGVKP